MASNVPRPEEVRALVESKDLGRVVMLNLLKFKPAGGVASYTEYARQVRPILDRLGAKVIFAGPVTSTVIGEQSWDSILLIEYPSRKVFVEMITSAEYQAIHHFRDEALERGELHAVSPEGGFVPLANSKV
jgi:uncharacterized protein (DUF1330 family)